MQRVSNWCFFLVTLVVFVASADLSHAQATAQPSVVQSTNAATAVITDSIPPDFCHLVRTNGF